MREIIFRGKRKDNGEWIFGYYFQKQNPFSEDGFPITHYISDCPPFGAEVDPETVGQFTGITDKNGKRIFEGDIIRMNGSDSDLAVVEFGEFACVSIEDESLVDMVNGWYYRPIPKEALSKLAPFCWDFQLNKMWIENICIEVIGNINDDPDLLEVHNA